MSGKDLFEGMSYVDERFVDEAENKSFPKRIVSPWIKVASMAACLCLIIFSLYNLQSYFNYGPTEGAGQEAADQMPEGEMDNVKDQISQESAIVSPEDAPAGEVPNTILYVEEMAPDGFIATVTEYGETSRLGLGTKLNVVIRKDTRYESADESNATSQDSKIDYTGCYVLIQYYEFYPDTNTIVVDNVYIIEEEG